MKILMKIWMLSLLGMMISCDKNDEVAPVEQLNKFRVKEISGHNELWGDFSMKVEYQENFLDKAWVINAAGDTVGRLNPATVMIKVPALTPEEIAALPEGSIVPKVWKPVYSLSKTDKEETVVTNSYRGNEVVKSVKETYLYEYDDSLSLDRKVLKWRKLVGDDEEVDVARMVYRYDGGRVVFGEYALYEVFGWKTTELWTYTYSGGRPVTIMVKSADGQSILEKKYVYTGNRLELTLQTGQQIQKMGYDLNSDGYVTRIDEGNGNYMDIKYEAGHGNFSDFIPEAVKLQGDPYIK